jgi:hypothetical protein
VNETCMHLDVLLNVDAVLTGESQVSSRCFGEKEGEEMGVRRMKELDYLKASKMYCLILRYLCVG